MSEPNGMIARYAKAVARPGHGDELAAKLLEVADSLVDTPGCLTYAINREPGAPDTVWVTELWRSQADVDASLAAAAESELMPAVLSLMDRDQGARIDLEPVGGVGLAPRRRSGATIVNLDDVEDMAPRFGLGDTGEARFARAPLGAERTGLSLQRLRPGARQTFGHAHGIDEEIYVVLAGSGRVALDDSVHELRRLDAVRVAPGTTRAFEAGPDGLELLAFGTHHPGDATLQPGFWAAKPAED